MTLPAAPVSFVATLVGGVTVLGAGVVLLLTGSHQVGAALAIAGATELGVKGITLAS